MAENVRFTQAGLEVLVATASPSIIRFTQVGLEVLVPFNLSPDVITAASVAPGTIEVVRTDPGAGVTVTLERNQGSGWWQVGEEFDADTVLTLHDESFDTFGTNPSYRTVLSDGVNTVSSNEVTVVLPSFVGPNQPTISILEIDGEDVITHTDVGLFSGTYSDSLGRTHAGVDWEVRTAGGEVVASSRVLVLDASWREIIITGLTPGATLYGFVRHLASDPDYVEPVPGEFSEGVEFTLLAEIDEPDQGEEPATVVSTTYKSEYPYGTFNVRLAIPEFDQDKTECTGLGVPWFANVTSSAGSHKTVFNDDDRVVDFTFAPAASLPSVGVSWKYRCIDLTPPPPLSGIKAYFVTHTANALTPFAPDTPFVFENLTDRSGSNIAPGQKVTTDALTFRWWEGPLMMCAGASSGWEGSVEDNSTILYDIGLLTVGRLDDFGGEWTIQAINTRTGAATTLATVPFGPRWWVEFAGAFSWVERRDHVISEVAEQSAEGWEEELDLSALPDGCYQIAVTLDGRVQRTTSPFFLAREMAAFRYAGETLTTVGATIGGSEGSAARWADTDDGVKYTGGAGTSSHLALPEEVGNPRTFDLIVEGAWATRKDVSAWRSLDVGLE